MGPVERSARTLSDDFRYELGYLGLAESLDCCREYGPDPGENDTAPARRIVAEALCTVDRLTARLTSLRSALDDAERGLRGLDN